MADSTLSALTAASTLDGTELHYVTQGGADRKATGSQIAAMAVGTAVPISALTASWTSAGTVYSGIDLDITDTASDPSSWMMRLHKGATTVFGVRRDGAFQFSGTFFTLKVPDSTSAGGNARGLNSVDLQIARSSATQVAGGQNSVAVGVNNTASGDYSIAMGYGCVASGSNSHAFGFTAQATGQSSMALGDLHIISGFASLGTGYQSIDRGIAFAHVHNGNAFANRGDNQTGNYNLSGSTTTATPLALTTDRAAVSASNQVVLPNGSAYLFKARVVGHRTDATGDNAAFEITGFISRDANAASTAIIGTPTVTVVGRVDATWTVAATADTTNGALVITVTGAAGKTIRWGAFVRTVEVTS